MNAFHYSMMLQQTQMGVLQSEVQLSQQIGDMSTGRNNLIFTSDSVSPVCSFSPSISQMICSAAPQPMPVRISVIKDSYSKQRDKSMNKTSSSSQVHTYVPLKSTCLC